MNLNHHDSTILSINNIREEIIEHRLEDTFQFDRSSPLVCKEANLSNQQSSSIETDVSSVEIQPSSYKANSQNLNATQ